MKRVVTATCLAAAFAVGLAAQSPTSSTQTPSASPNQRGATGPRTVTGCLRAGDKEGTFMLTDVVMPGGARSGDTTGTTGGTTAGGGARRTGTPGGSSGAGTTTGEPTTSAAGGSTAGSTTAGSSAYGTGGQGGGRGARSMNITAVRMISESCS